MNFSGKGRVSRKKPSLRVKKCAFVPNTPTKAKNAVSLQNSEPAELKELIDATVKLWHKHHLTYAQAGYVGKEVRRRLSIKRAKSRKNVIHRLSRDGEQKLIAQAYRENSSYGLLLKTLFLTGARVSEFVSVKVEEFYFDEQMILIQKGKGGKKPLCADAAGTSSRTENSSRLSKNRVCFRVQSPYEIYHSPDSADC